MHLQHQLSEALDKRDLASFKKALDSGADPNTRENHKASIYEKTLLTAGCAQFIKLCLQYHCSVHYLNEKIRKAAINYVIDSKDAENLKVLLEHEGIQVNHKYNHLTPLNSLAKNITADTANQVFECMRLLLLYGASPNTFDDNDMTPLHYLLSNSKIDNSQKVKLLNLFLRQPDIDIEICEDNLRQDLLSWNPELLLPPVVYKNTSPKVSIEMLERALRDGNEKRFEELLVGFVDDKTELLTECIKNGCHKAFELLLQCDININGQSENYQKTFVELAVGFGNWYILEKLLQHEALRLPSNLELLTRVVSRLDERPTKPFSDFKKCFEVLLASRHVNVNETDISGRTPLHYAIKYNNEFAIKELLIHGAYLGMMSNFKEMAVEEIDADLLEEHFDRCITANDKSRADKEYEISMTYTTLKLRDTINTRLRNEMELIVAIGKSKNLRHLLSHPLVSTIISLKWKSLAKLFYSYFWVSTILSIILILNIFFLFSAQRHTISFKSLSWIAIVYFVLCELLKIALSGLKWVSDRIFNVILIILLIVCNTKSEPYEYYIHITAAFAILFIALKLTHLVGSLPIFSLHTYILMLRQVILTFFKSCIPYSILLFSFGLSFSILKFHETDKKSIFEAIIKIIIMSTGELNASDLNYNNFIFAYIFYLVFVVFNVIVLMNLLSGLAFGDIQAIQAEAGVNSLQCHCNLLSCYEVILTQRWGRFKSLQALFNRLVKIKVAAIPESISTFPNQDQIPNHFITSASNSGGTPLIGHSSIYKEKSYIINVPQDRTIQKLSSKVVLKLVQILDKKSKAEELKQLEVTKARQLKNIEALLTDINNRIK